MFSQFKSLLKLTKHYEPFMQLHELHKLPWRATQEIYLNNSIRPNCLMCSNYTTYQCRGLGFFNKYCSSKCQNNCPLKIAKQNVGVKAFAKNNANLVLEAFAEYKNEEILYLTEIQIAEFTKVINSISGLINEKEINILKALTVEYRKIWCNLPATSSSNRSQMATGKIPLISFCVRCKSRVSNPHNKSLKIREYCSLKCSNITVAKFRYDKNNNGVLMHEANKKLCKNPVYRKHKGLLIKNAMLEIYGVTNPSQVPKFRNKAMKTMLSSKIYILNNKQVVVQGYEPEALNYLLKYVNADDIEVESNGNVPNFNYLYKGVKRKYFPDMYIISKNTIVEVKSIYTLFGGIQGTGKYGSDFWRKNCAKFKAVTAAGYKTCLMLMHKGKKVEVPENWFYYPKSYLEKLLKDRTKLMNLE